MVSDSNSSNKLKVVLPVVFTFGATLLFFQGTARADSVTTDNAQTYTTTQTTKNNYQASTTERLAASQPTNSDPNQGAVDLNPSAVQSAASAPVVNNNPGHSNNQVTATSANAQNTTTTSGVGNVRTAGLSASQVNFLNSIHQGTIDGWNQYKILPSLTAAQAICESAWGQSALTTQGHNLFGIKGSYNGHSVTMPTYEYYGGRYVRINAPFRAYSSNSESIVDHGRFLTANSRYHNLVGQRDYRVATRLIREDGYATDPHYTTTLNAVIQRYNLTAWDQEAFNQTTNTGYLDNLSVQGNTLKVSGWHASSVYNSNMHHFIILIDGNTKQELYRQEVAGSYRQDVQSVYPNVAISGWGGFNLSIPYSANFAGRAIQVVSRYTYNTNGEPNGGQDLFYNPITLNANAAYLDDFTLNASDNTVHISGWHAADQSMGKAHHFIIIYDASKGRELGRYEANSTIRNDVAKVYNAIYQSGKSGFNLNLHFNGALAGDQIQVISRYSDSANGEGSYVDYWFAPKTFTANDACLDRASVTGNQLTVAGWHAADASAAQPYHFIIIYDATTKREVARQRVDNSYRPDVQQAMSHDYNAAWSGFQTSFTLPANVSGHQIQVISRYSNAMNGEGQHTDYWFKPIYVTIK